MQEAANSSKPDKPVVTFTRKKSRRRRINEIRRLASKGSISRQQEKELLEPLL